MKHLFPLFVVGAVPCLRAQAGEANLYLQLQDARDPYSATGARLFFDHIRVNRESKEIIFP